jgi:hypothetical protein
MKIQLTFKTPDVVDYALEDLSEDDKEIAKEVIKKFVTYDEYITVEVDTELETCDVLPVK